MLDLFNLPTPQGCNIQTFYKDSTWLKPRGCSHIYILAIGPGGDGTAITGGGSGAVTVWYGSAQHVPDSLLASVGSQGGFTSSGVRGRFSNSGAIGTALLTATGASGTTGGTVMTANQFCASGFFQSIAGQNGSSGNPGASATTFLNAGGASMTANYGYATTGNTQGNFQMQPIIVGIGGSGTANGGIGGGGGATNGIGGPGLVLIASW